MQFSSKIIVVLFDIFKFAKLITFQPYEKNRKNRNVWVYYQRELYGHRALIRHGYL